MCIIRRRRLVPYYRGASPWLQGADGLWGNFRRRIIVISTMERSVRITFLSGAALVVVAIIVKRISRMPAATQSGLPIGGKQ